LEQVQEKCGYGAGVVAIYVVNADGSDVRELVRVSEGEYLNFSPSQPWSPDGNKLTFTLSRNGSSKLYVADVDTGQNLALTSFSVGYEGGCEWSPDGKRMAFTSRLDGEEGPTIYVVDADGHNLRHVVDIVDDLSPIYWAPDSAHFALLFQGADQKPAIFIAMADESQVVQLAVSDAATARRGPLAWSPDSRQIAVVQEDALQIVNISTGDSIRVVPPAELGWGYEAKWSPDGAWIATSASADVEYEATSDGWTVIGDKKEGVFLVNPDNGDVVPLIALPNWISELVWMSDGNRLAFFEYPEGEPPVGYVVGLDGQVLRKIEADCKWPLD
jgi:Tol biopolymer transport system component